MTNERSEQSDSPRRTVPVRLPDEIAAEVERMARMNGITPGMQIERAWRWWWRRHGDRIVDEMHATVEAMRPKGTSF